MKRKLAVSETEWEILKMLWKHGESIRQSELLSLFEKEGREWKRQTLNTFLSRLEKKGLVRREGGMATPVYNEEEYNVMQMRGHRYHVQWKIQQSAGILYQSNRAEPGRGNRASSIT